MSSTFTGGIVPGLAFLNFTGNLNTTRVGTYGQFALGVAGQLVGTGWLGYVRGDYRTGDNIEGYSVNGGIRYQFAPDPPAAGSEGSDRQVAGAARRDGL